MLYYIILCYIEIHCYYYYYIYIYIEYIRCIMVLCCKNGIVLIAMFNMKHMNIDILKISILSQSIKRDYAKQLFEYLRYKRTIHNIPPCPSIYIYIYTHIHTYIYIYTHTYTY